MPVLELWSSLPSYSSPLWSLKRCCLSGERNACEQKAMRGSSVEGELVGMRRCRKKIHNIFYGGKNPHPILKLFFKGKNWETWNIKKWTKNLLWNISPFRMNETYYTFHILYIYIKFKSLLENLGALALEKNPIKYSVLLSLEKPLT